MTEVLNWFLLGCMGLITVLVFLCLFRAIKGPRFTDRLVASNMIGTLTIVFIILLSYYLKESYLLDVGIVYALLSFLAVVVICRIAAFRFYGTQLHKEDSEDVGR